MRPTRHALLLIAVTALCPTWACDRRVQENQEWAMAGQEALKLSTSLAKSTRTGLPQLKKRIQVWVNQGEIGIDESNLWVGLDTATLDRLAKLKLEPRRGYPELALVDRKLPAEALRTPEGYFIEPMYETFGQARERSKKLATLLGSTFRGEVVLWVEDQVPFSTLSRLLYTLGQAEFSRFQFAVSSPDGIRNMAVESPRYCAGSDCPPPDKPRECKDLTVSVQAGGIVCRERIKTGDGVLKLLGEIRTKEAGSLLDVLGEGDGLGIQGLEGIPTDRKSPPPKVAPPPPSSPGCHDHPRKGPDLDLTSLRTRLEAGRSKSPACPTATLSATDEIPWQELVSVADLLAQFGHTNFIMSVALGDDRCGD